MAEKLVQEGLPRGLIFRSEHSSLLVFSSNCSAQSNDRPKCDEDARNIVSTMNSAGIISHSHTALITTTSGSCTKKGLVCAIDNQISMVVPDEDSLFILVYCGGACETIPDTHSLMLTDYSTHNTVSGVTIANAITKSQTKPRQLLIILDCPYAEEIGSDIENNLNTSTCDLCLIVSQRKGVVSSYLSPLQNSTFSYFLCKFLSQDNCSNGVVKLKSVFSKVEACCNALSSLKMVRDGRFIMSKNAIPKGRFVQIIKSAEATMAAIEEKADNDLDDWDIIDSSSGGENLAHFLQFYKKYLFKKLRPLCKEAKDWVHVAMTGPLQVLHDHAMLEGPVLSAIVGVMMASIATIQSECPAPNDSIKYSNIFIKAYVYVAAAVCMFKHHDNLFHMALLQNAQEFYSSVLHSNNIGDKEITDLLDQMKT